MKILFLFLVMVCCANGQTLKWTAIPPPPSFDFDHGVDMICKGDTSGDLAVGLTYTLNGINAGSQILWYSSSGKLIKADSIGTTLPMQNVVFISPAVLIVQLGAGSTSVLRKYTRKGLTIISKDTAIGSSESAISSSYDIQDRLGLFTFSYSSDAGVSNLSAIRRYLR